MLTIEDYIAKRKKEDNINEFSYDCMQDNIRTCVNYVFEYFNTYLKLSIFEQRTILKDENVAKYSQTLSKYDPEIHDWLINTYIDCGKQVNKAVMALLAKDQFFFLTSSEREFRELSYEVYAKIVKKIPSVKGQAEMVYKYIKEYHRVKSFEKDFDKLNLPPVIVKWIEGVRSKYRVDVTIFAEAWDMYFSDNNHLWPQSHKIKNNLEYRGLEYDYDYKQKSNLFNLDDLYKRLTKKVFLRGHKQEIELLLMYFWVNGIDRDPEYWNHYLEKVLPSLEEKEEED